MIVSNTPWENQNNVTFIAVGDKKVNSYLDKFEALHRHMVSSPYE